MIQAQLSLSNTVKETIELSKKALETYPGYCILFFMILSFIKYDLITVSISGCIIYITILIKQYIKNKIEQENIKSIDLDRVGSIIEGSDKKSILDIINDHVENCFDRDVLFFNVIDKDDYITSEVERSLLNELLDSALINMSNEVRIKLSQYVGSDNLTHLIARRCMMVVTIFVANHNKNIYQRTKENKIEL